MKYCSKCGQKCNDNDIFCGKCGHKLEEDVVKNETIIDATIKEEPKEETNSENASASINENVNPSANNDTNKDLLHQDLYKKPVVEDTKSMELVFGILSIILSFSSPLIGQIVGAGLAIFGLVKYPHAKYKALNIVGLVLNILFFIVSIIVMILSVLYGWGLFNWVIQQ